MRKVMVWRERPTTATTLSVWAWCEVTYDEQGHEVWCTWYL